MKTTVDQVQLSDLGSWFGKMYPELLAQTKAQTSEPSCKKRSALSAKKPPLFLCLQTDGRQPDASLTWKDIGVLRGAYSTLSFGESPSVAVESHLSQILEEHPLPKYSLSAKACQGILRRAGRRGKELPEVLRLALERQGAGVAYCIQGNCIDRADTAACNGKGWTEGVSYTLNTVDRPAVFAFQSFGEYLESAAASTLRSRDAKDATDLVVYKKGTRPHTAMETQRWEPAKIADTLTAFDVGESRAATLVCQITRSSVRRLTPLEHERLQGFPDGWTDIGEWTDTKGKIHKESTDTARYKALGNSIALPPWTYVLTKLSQHCGTDCTMASLFDGIGGFPLIWERINGQGACLWASEIEEFPIAVTKKRFLEIKGVSEDAAAGVAEGE